MSLGRSDNLRSRSQTLKLASVQAILCAVTVGGIFTDEDGYAVSGFKPSALAAAV